MMDEMVNDETDMKYLPSHNLTISSHDHLLGVISDKFDESHSIKHCALR